jgi:hypothetical protein
MDRAQTPFYCSSHETVQVSINLQSKATKETRVPTNKQTHKQTKWTDWSVRDCHTHEYSSCHTRSFQTQYLTLCLSLVHVCKILFIPCYRIFLQTVLLLFYLKYKMLVKC